MFFIQSTIAKEETVAFKEVSLKVASAFCRRMGDCSAEKMLLTDCIYEMDSIFINNFAQLPLDKKIQLTRVELETCVKKIESISCGDLKKSRKISNCEFLQKLAGE